MAFCIADHFLCALRRIPRLHVDDVEKNVYVFWSFGIGRLKDARRYSHVRKILDVLASLHPGLCPAIEVFYLVGNGKGRSCWTGSGY